MKIKNSITLANARNGLPLVENPDGISMFLSTHGHRPPYFRVDAMPYNAVICLLRGGIVRIVDGSARKPMPDSLMTGVGTWALVFGRAIKQFSTVPWMTEAMKRACWDNYHRPTVQAIRRLAGVYGTPPMSLRVYFMGPERVTFGSKTISHYEQAFPIGGPAIICESVPAPWDDRPAIISQALVA